MPRIYFIDPRGRFDFGDSDVISRHYSYINTYEQNFSEPLEIDVMGSTEREISGGLKGTWITVRTFNLFKYIYRAQLQLRGQKDSVFVASDPWFSFAAAIGLQKTRKSQDKIQLQLHGQFLNSSKSGFKRFASLQYLKFCIHLSDQVRFVNQEEYLKFLNECPNARQKMFCAPVPINEVFFSKNFTKAPPRALVLGLVGRLHPERGLKQFVELAMILKSQFANLKLLIIGEGKIESEFRQHLNRDFGSNFEFTGKLSPQELALKLPDIGVLASCAPSEGYGRSMREALLLGVPVLATLSDGSRELAEKLPRTFFELFDLDVDSDQAIVEKFSTLLEATIPKNEIIQMLDIDQNPGLRLVNRWNDLIQRGR
jgi:glycosyltransferase involved in cell wall biosynthesis